jgi:hypothetical protein
MRLSRFLYRTALAAALLGTKLMAQEAPETAVPFAFQQMMTTGMVGFTNSQTVRINVLNLNAVPAVMPMAATNAPTSVPACTVEMQFVDTANKPLLQKTVTNFVPQTAISLDLDRTALAAPVALRNQVRGVVTVNPISSTAATGAATTLVGWCNVMVTLEVFDTLTGNTVTFTSDTRSTTTNMLSGVFRGMATVGR